MSDAPTKLTEARNLLGITQIELDREAGLPRGTTHDLEAGRVDSPSHRVVIKIVRALQRRGLAGATSEAIFPVPDDKAVA